MIAAIKYFSMNYVEQWYTSAGILYDSANKSLFSANAI